MANIKCLSCEIANEMFSPTGGKIVSTKYFNAHQDVAYPIPGLIILASNRHFYDLDDMTDDEANDYIHLLKKIRMAQRSVLEIDKVYYFYNEDTTHHFHTWMVPRYEWMKTFGRSIESVRPVLLYAKNHMFDSESMQKVTESVKKLRLYFDKMSN